MVQLEHNRNILVKESIYKLKTTHNALIFRGDIKIYKLYSINEDYKGELYFEVGTTIFKLRLSKLA